MRDPSLLGRVRAALFGAAVAVAAADLVVKAAAARVLAGRGTVDLPGPVDLRLLFNPGAAFGLGAALPAAAVVAVTGLVVVGVVVYAWRAAPTLGRAGRAGLAVVLGGAVGNLVDRALDGVVTDYLHTGWWPTFNLADVAIVTGAGLLLLQQPPTATQHRCRRYGEWTRPWWPRRPGCSPSPTSTTSWCWPNNAGQRSALDHVGESVPDKPKPELGVRPRWRSGGPRGTPTGRC